MWIIKQNKTKHHTQNACVYVWVVYITKSSFLRMYVYQSSNLSTYLLCHLYKLYERLILNRLSPIIEHVLIPEQAGFRPGKSCTAQVLNLTQIIEGGFETVKITGIVLVDLSAAYDTVNHRRLLEKGYNMTRDYRLMSHGGTRSRWRSHRNGLPQGSVLAPLLFDVYTNDQPIHPGTRSLVYADDLAVTTQSTDIAPIEETLTSALNGLSEYYTTNQSVRIRQRRKSASSTSGIVNVENSSTSTSLCLLASHWTERFRIKHISRRPKRKSKQETT